MIEFAQVRDVPGAVNPPNAGHEYRVVVAVGEGGDPPRGFLKAGRLYNLLETHGALGGHHIVAVVYGSAVPSVIADNSACARAAIDQLNAAGITVAVCSQAVVDQGFRPKDIVAGVRLDVSAVTTLATLQVEGYALIV
ncbi:MAG: DsrE family protein [Sphingomonadales bacterium]|nr:DsrE family protein [Sphingomonadales bacterium]